MRCIYLFLFVVFISLTVNAQQGANIDSLKSVYEKAKPDTSKITTINNLVNAYLYADAAVAKQYIDEGLELSDKLGNTKGKALFNYQNGVYYSFTTEKDSSAFSYRKAIEYAGEDIKMKRKAISGLGLLASNRGDLVEADSLLKEALKLDIALKDSVGIAISYNQIGRICQMKGHFQIAQDYLQKSVRILEQTNDEIRLADAYNSIAANELRQKNYASSIPYNEKATAIYIKYNDDYFLPQSYLDLGIAYYKTGELEKAVSYWNKSLKLTERKKLYGISASIYHSFARYYRDQKNYIKAVESGKRSLELAQKAANSYKITQAQNLLAQMYNLTKKPQLALGYGSSAVEGAEKTSNSIALLTALEARGESYKMLADYKKSSEDQRRFIVLQDSIFNKEKLLQIEEQRAIFDLERKEAEIKTLNLEVEKSNLQKALYAGGIIALLAVIGLGYFSFQQRSKRKTTEFEKREELMKNELAFKKKELLSQTLHLVNKNTLIQDLQENLTSLRKTSENQTQEISRIIKNLKQEATSDNNWAVFKSYFNQVHNDFDQKLKNLSDEITDNDIRLAAFLKMKLSTKEIAAMLNVQPDSVLKSKYRLKKKFSLEKEDDFDAFLEQV